MSDYDDSVSRLFAELKAGDHSAATRLWDLFFLRLLAAARGRLARKGIPTRVTDEDDIAASVFESLFEGAANGRFAEHRTRDDLWRLMLCIARQKVVKHVRRNTALKRGGGDVEGESAFLAPDGSVSMNGLEQVVSEEPTPEFVATLKEENTRLLDLLQDDTLRRVALLRLEGHSDQEIADQLQVSLRTVERKLKLIRERWKNELEPPSAGAVSK